MRDYDFIGRYGGEEFLLLLPGCDETSARDVAERVRAGISAKPARIGDVELVVSASLGVAWTASGTTGSNVLIQAADEALHQAKTLGRNRVEICATGTT
jgi:diguanylate cyclase (GGDEF)-like protein